MLIGKWKGVYTYKEKWLQSLIGHEETHFEIIIQEVDNKQTYWGEIQDDVTTGGTPGIGKFEGKIKGNVLTFKKLMPIYSYISNTDEFKTNKKRKHTPIYYSGQLSDDGTTVEGTWKMKMSIHFYYFIPVPTMPMYGKFKMYKV